MRGKSFGFRAAVHKYVVLIERYNGEPTSGTHWVLGGEQYTDLDDARNEAKERCEIGLNTAVYKLDVVVEASRHTRVVQI
jgi:hypothetical protein